MLLRAFALLTLVLLPTLLQAEDKTSPDATTEEGAVIALSMGEQITTRDLQPDEQLIRLNQQSLDDEAFADWHQRARIVRLTELIFIPLLSEFSSEQGIDASASEIDEFITLSEKAKADAEAQFVKQREEFLAQLENRNIAPSERTHLEAQLRTLEAILGSKTEMEKRAREKFGDDYEVRMREINEGIARQAIVEWKLNKTLFDRYGGRIVFTDEGPEPLEAYSAFLAEKKKAGAFGIYDAELQAAFWDYFQSDTLHNFYSAEESHDIMSQPWWERVARATSVAD